MKAATLVGALGMRPGIVVPEKLYDGAASSSAGTSRKNNPSEKVIWWGWDINITM